MAEKIETGIMGFDQRVQYTIKRLPFQDCVADEAAGIKAYKNFVWFYVAIRIRLDSFTDIEKRDEIAKRLEQVLKEVRQLGELGLEVISTDEMAVRGAQLARTQSGKTIPLGSVIEKERAAQIFETDFCRNETRVLAFLRAFEGMVDLFEKAIDDEAFLWALEAQYPPIKTMGKRKSLEQQTRSENAHSKSLETQTENE